MTEKKKVVVVGNCQARPIATLLEAMSEEVEVTQIAIVHLLKSEQEAEYKPFFEEADYIIAQLVAPNYPCEFVRTDWLEKFYSNKLVKVVNLFCYSHTPYLRNLPQKLRSGEVPFGDYHFPIVYEYWEKGEDINNTVLALNEQVNNIKDVGSYDELATREQQADVGIVDYIKKSKKRLFHTFNHPCNGLLLEYSKRILSYLDIKVKPLSNIDKPVGTLLGQFIPFIENDGEYQHKITKDTKVMFKTSLELVSEFYGFYKKNFNKMKYSNSKLFSETVNLEKKDIPLHPRLQLPKQIITPEVSVSTNLNVHVKVAKEPIFVDIVDSNDSATLEYGRVLNLFTPGAVVYTHWLFDLLPKIHCLERLGFNYSDFDQIIVNGKDSSFQKQSIKALGIDRDKLLTLNELDGKIIKCQSFTQVTAVRKHYATPKWSIEFIKKLFPKVKPLTPPGEKIYISRNKSARRKVLNEESIVPTLNSLGYSVIYAEDYSVNEMHWIMDNAKKIAAPHGAGIANIAFCSSGVEVYEFFSEHISPEYYIFSNVLGFKHNLIPCKNSDGFYFNELNLDYANDFFSINFADMLISESELNLLKK